MGVLVQSCNVQLDNLTRIGTLMEGKADSYSKEQDRHNYRLVLLVHHICAVLPFFQITL